MEQQPNSERIEKEKVLEMLRTNGFDHQETKKLMLEWLKQQETNVKTAHDTTLFELNVADLYLAAGKIEDSLKSLEDALNMADQENEVELQDQIVLRLKEFRAKYPDIVKKFSTFPLKPESEDTIDK